MSDLIIGPETIKRAEAEVRRQQEKYMNSPITRAEFDSTMRQNFGMVNAQMQAANTNFALNAAVILYVCEKLGITQEEIDAWKDAKRAEIEAAIKAKQNGGAEPLQVTEADNVPCDADRNTATQEN
jgi:hypothetical protein